LRGGTCGGGLCPPHTVEVPGVLVESWGHPPCSI
jgi:hypothetical protein